MSEVWATFPLTAEITFQPTGEGRDDLNSQIAPAVRGEAESDSEPRSDSKWDPEEERGVGVLRQTTIRLHAVCTKCE